MDSCHIFNFLFGTRKATTELSRCFSTIGEQEVKKKASERQKKRQKGREANQAPLSPLKQLQMRVLSSFTSAPANSNNPKKDDNHNEVAKECCTKECGTYRAVLVDPVVEDELEGNIACERVNLVENPSQIIDEIEKNGLECDPSPKKFRQQSSLSSSSSSSSSSSPSPAIPSEQRKPKRVVLYTDCEEQIQHATVTNGKIEEEEEALDREFGQVRAQLRRFSNDNGEDNELKIRRDKFRNEQDKSINNERVKNLVQSFESSQLLDSDHSISDFNDTPTRSQKPITFVKPLPPQKPPKTNKVKCLNHQLSLNKPTKIDQLFQDEDFLARFFDNLEPLDRCVAAQVCRSWRNILYSDRSYWKDLISVIDCTQLRREHLVECIVNALQTAKLKQQKSIDSSQKLSARLSNRISANSCAESTQQNFISRHILDNDHHHHHHHHHHQQQQQQQQHQLQSDQCFDFDHDDVWRIQELCNRFARGSAYSFMMRTNDFNGNNHHTEAQQIPNHVNCQASKSSSIPSQISSTLSSVSISSLLSPLSETSRIESMKEKLYTSLDDRGFDAICLFGANDDDIEDLVGKTPNSALQRILAARLSNCCITDRGLDLFISKFNQVEDLELSGCNEITNSLNLRPLEQLKRLKISDCINIADGIAQRIMQIAHQLNEFTLQSYHLTDAFLEYLCLNSDLTHLERLELPNCKEITNQSMLTIAKNFPQLQALSISGSTKITDDGIEFLIEQTRELKYLDLSWCSKITNASLECIACDLNTTLTDLILDRNAHITDNGIGYLATMSNLTLLHIRWCPRISDIGLETLLPIKSLRYLSLAGLHQITARSLLSLPETDLLEVELTNCPAVNGDLLRFLSAKMPKCNIIF